jgi:hypothetical protein
MLLDCIEVSNLDKAKSTLYKKITAKTVKITALVEGILKQNKNKKKSKK